MESYDLENHVNKCRCCFRVFDIEHEKVNLNEVHKYSFYYLNQIELHLDPVYSQYICKTCDADLEKCAKFKIESSERQQSLYDNFPLVKQESIVYEEEFVELSNEELQEVEEIEDESSSNLRNEQKLKECSVVLEKMEILEDDSDTEIVFAIETENDENSRIHRRSTTSRKRRSDIGDEEKSSSRKQLTHHRYQQETQKSELECPICNAKFMTKFTFLSHVYKEYKTEDGNDCKICGENFSTIHKFREHFQGVHNNMNKICDHCDFSTIHKCHLIDHMERYHSSEKSYECKICKYKTSILRYLKSHMKDHCNEVASLCSVCGHVAKSQKMLSQHMNKKHPNNKVEIFTCTICSGLTFRTQKSLDKHVKVVHSNIEPTIECEQCERKYFDEESLKAHIKRFHELTVKCIDENCDLMFNCESRMLNHHKTKHENYVPEPFLCNLCGKSLSSKSNLKKHLDWHENGSVKQFSCDVCGKMFSSAKSLKRHSIHHYKETKDIECDQCGRTYYTEDELRAHMRTVHELIYPCEFCGKIFTRLYAVREHIGRLHSETPPQYPCYICAKTFTNKQSLKKHITMLHTDLPKSIKCEICGSLFKNKQQVRIHIKFSHLGKFYDCVYPSCTVKFARKHALKRHLYRKHITKGSAEEETYLGYLIGLQPT